MTFTIFRTNFLIRNLQNVRKMSKTALVLLADGAEEMEAVISIDVLRRGGIDVTVAGLPDANIRKCSRNVNIKPDISITDITNKYDAVILPGGLGGSKALAESKEVGKLLKEQEGSGRIVAAICAAPIAFKAHGIALDKKITSYPSVEKELTGYKYEQENVVVDGNVVTSRGPGTAFDFGLKLVEILVGKEKRQEIAKAMLLH